VQCTLGQSDYVRRDAALQCLIVPLAGEYGLAAEYKLGKTHRQLFADFYASVTGQPLDAFLASHPACPHAEHFFASMLNDVANGGGQADAMSQASYALGYNLAVEYLAAYEKTWMLDAFRVLNDRVLAAQGGQSSAGCVRGRQVWPLAWPAAEAGAGGRRAGGEEAADVAGVGPVHASEERQGVHRPEHQPRAGGVQGRVAGAQALQAGGHVVNVRVRVQRQRRVQEEGRHVQLQHPLRRPTHRGGLLWRAVMMTGPHHAHLDGAAGEGAREGSPM
jgi:hypothetical protein